MKTIKLIIILALFFILSCDEESNQKPVPIDPCADAIQKSAEFDTYECISYGDSCLKSINFLYDNIVVFKAKHSCKTYEWLVGDDTTRRFTKEFELKFDTDYKNVGVRLITTWDKDTCLPNDPGIDTSYSKLNFYHWEESNLLGTFKVATEENPLDSFIIDITYDIWQVNPKLRYVYYINNLPFGCEKSIIHTKPDYISPQWTSIRPGYNLIQGELGMTPNDKCPYFRFWIKIINENEIIIDCYQPDLTKSNNGKMKKISGVRI